jgi:S-phase kinase-associated protein 1
MSETTKNVILISKEGDQFTVEKDIAWQSVLVRTMLEDDDDDSTPQIPLPNVTSKALVKIIEFCKYHHQNGPMKEIEKPLTSTDLKIAVSEWDGTFIQSFEQEDLFELILAANFIDLQPLLDLACAQVATQIKGKTPEEIRQTFNIENDFTPEEEEQIREENKWCTD